MKRAAISGTMLLLVAATSSALTGCETVFDESDTAQERRARVMRVYPANAPAGEGDTHCTDRILPEGMTRIALVAYRLGRLSYWQSFPIPPDMTIASGDTVIVHPRRCTLTGPAPADSSG